MADIHTGHTVDRVDPKSAQPDMKADPLFTEWAAMHQNSQQRLTTDNQACSDARSQDQASISGRTAGTLSAADKTSGDRDDLKGDFQAIGKHKGERGDDQNNRDDDMKIVGLDRQMLAKYGSHMSAEQREAIQADIKAKLRTSDNSNSDIANENAFIQGDKREMAALRSGNPEQIEAANQAQLALRQRDAAAETRYIADNNTSKASDDKVLSLFGAVKITDSK